MSRVSRRTVLSAALIVPMTGLLAPVALVAARGSAEATEGTVAGTYIIRCREFKAREMISTWLTGPQQQVIGTDLQRADDQGNCEFTLRMPRHHPAGQWAITVHGLGSDREAVAYFQVVYRPPDGSANVSPASGPPGTTFAFAATGFSGGEDVSYWFLGPDGQNYEGGYAVAAPSGRVDCSYATSESQLPGVWQATLYGTRSDHLATALFTVVAP